MSADLEALVTAYEAADAAAALAPVEHGGRREVAATALVGAVDPSFDLDVADRIAHAYRLGQQSKLTPELLAALRSIRDAALVAIEARERGMNEPWRNIANGRLLDAFTTHRAELVGAMEGR